MPGYYTEFVVGIVAIGGFTCGWDIGVISGNLKVIAQEFELTLHHVNVERRAYERRDQANDKVARSNRKI